jgi:tetratricopeptide (TPR) repeat protein
MKNLVFSTLLFFGVGYLHAAESPVELTIQLLDQDLIADATMERDAFMDWSKGITGDFTACLEKLGGKHSIMMLITIHKDADVSLDIAMKPAFNDSIANAIKTCLQPHLAFRTNLVDYALIFYATVNGGAKGDYQPTVLYPVKQRIKDFKAMDLAGKKAELQSWTQTYIVPVVSYYENNVDKVFKGVLSVGAIMDEERYMTTEIDELTYENPDYWRGVMEMEQANLLIPFSKVCMHLAKGEFDKARRLLYLVRIFSNNKTLPMVYYDELSTKLNLFFEAHDDVINKGIALHDAGKFDDAIKLYSDLLAIYPNSGWAQYELYFSTVSKEGLTDISVEWAAAKQIVYGCDEMYPTEIHASNGKEAWLLSRRNEINQLFHTQGELIPDLVNYADIALDLGNYGFAAQLYWLLNTQVDKKKHEGHDMLAYYLYCMNHLGNTETMKIFAGDFGPKFEKIEKTRQKAMEKNAMYKAMAN